jgi:phospholipid/cholesterol/gamma-HCH transport system substrate-binding protein
MAKIEATFDNIKRNHGTDQDGHGVVGRLLTDDALAARLDDLGAAVKDLSTLLASIERGEGAIGSLTTKGGDAEIAIADLKEAAGSLKRIAARLESKEGLFGKLVNDDAYSNQLAGNLKDAVSNLSAITKKINEGKGTLGMLINDRTLYDSAEDVITGVNDSKFANWMLRHYQKKGIAAPSPPPSPAP